MHFTAERLQHVLQSLPSAKTYYVGFSGGADSTALLHALSDIPKGRVNRFEAVHINHGLHPDAGSWQTHCERFCHQRGIKLHCLRIGLDQRSGRGVEAEARQLRYQALESLLEPGDVLLTAHHADDQAETLLLNLLRGSGVEGLSAMPVHRPLGTGFLQRPLLEYQNTALVKYLLDEGIEWVEDPSNQVLSHDRNFLRHSVMPILESRWPGVAKRLNLTRKAMADARYLLKTTADEQLHRQLDHPRVLHVADHMIQDSALFRLLLRAWLKQSAVPSIPAYSLETLLQQVRHARDGNSISVQWAAWRLRFYRQRLWLHPDTNVLQCPTTGWADGGKQTDLGKDAGQLVLNHPAPVALRGEFRVSGRKECLKNSIRCGRHTRSLKNLFQMWGVPPWLRDCVPLCSQGDELVAIGDWCFSDQFERWMSDHHLELNWIPKNPLLRYIRDEQHSAMVDPASVVR